MKLSAHSVSKPKNHTKFSQPGGGGSRIFSRGGDGWMRGVGGFSKNFENFVDLFFEVYKIDFQSSPKALKNHVLAKSKFLRRRQNFEKQAEKAFLGTFFKTLIKTFGSTGGRIPRERRQPPAPLTCPCSQHKLFFRMRIMAKSA